MVKLFIWDFLSVRNFTKNFGSGSFGRCFFCVTFFIKVFSWLKNIINNKLDNKFKLVPGPYLGLLWEQGE